MPWQFDVAFNNAILTLLLLFPLMILFVYKVLKTPRWVAVLLAIPPLILLAIPLWFVHLYVLDLIYSGKFHYARGSDIRFSSIHFLIPDAATDIDLIENGGCQTRFRLTAADRNEWFKHLGVENPTEGRTPFRGEWEHCETKADRKTFESVGWAVPLNMKVLCSPSARNGARFEVWYRDDIDEVFIDCSLW